MGDSLTLALGSHERLSRFLAVATALGSAKTEDEVLKRTVHAARSLARADNATLTLLGEGPARGRVSWAGYGSAPVAASLEREIRVRDRPWATLRLATSRRRFTREDETLVDLLCVHAALAAERAALRGDDDVLRRVRALVGGPAAERHDGATVREVGDVRLDLRRHEAFVGGTPVHLTPSEFRLLELLSEEPGRVYSRREIVARLWDSDHAGSPRVADAHVARLRRKIEEDPRHPERLQQVRGVGYKLVPRPGRQAPPVPVDGTQ